MTTTFPTESNKLRVIVCGGRDYDDKEKVFEVLDQFKDRITFLITGGARGADNLAVLWAKSRGISWIVVPANWKKEGKAAGMKRNQKMIDLFYPHLVIAFPGGKGTKDMIRRAKMNGIPVVK